MSIKKILWIRAGGTIACVETSDGLSPSADLFDSAAFKNILPNDVVCESLSLFNIDSTDITPEHWRILSRKVFEGRRLYDGFVITHGTDTMQYSTAALSIMLESFDKPVVFTGSMRPFGAKDSDAPFNLAAAFVAARDLSSVGQCGVFAVFAGKIMRGLSCVKINTTDDDAFTDVKGNIGEVTSSGARLFDGYNFDKPKQPAVLKDKLCEKVFVLKITPTLGVNDGVADFLIKSGYKGVVCEAYGLGGIPSGFLDELSRVVESGIRVVIVSKCLFGGANLNVYAAHRQAARLSIETWNLPASAALVGLMGEIGGRRIPAV